MVIQYLIALSLMIVLNCFYMIGIATLPMLFPLTDDIKCNLDSIQQSLRDKRKRKKMVEPLAQFVQFHSNTTQFSFGFPIRLIPNNLWLFSPSQAGTWFIKLLARYADDAVLKLHPFIVQRIAADWNENGDSLQHGSVSKVGEVQLILIKLPIFFPFASIKVRALTRWKWSIYAFNCLEPVQPYLPIVSLASEWAWHSMESISPLSSWNGICCRKKHEKCYWTFSLLLKSQLTSPFLVASLAIEKHSKRPVQFDYCKTLKNLACDSPMTTLLMFLWTFFLCRFAIPHILHSWSFNVLITEKVIALQLNSPDNDHSDWPLMLFVCSFVSDELRMCWQCTNYCNWRME